ncbi:MAG: QueT transporter family protein [Clostridia bacterium]|nr:QueT transporter family protein [Clostridia bacterium]
MNRQQKQRNSKLLFMANAGVIAALYTVLTLVLAPLSFGNIQFRASEALTLLPVFTPAAIPGLTIGCILSNAVGVATGSNIAGWIDVIFGSAATLMAALLSRWLRRMQWKGIPVLAIWPPVILNALIVGGELAVVYELPFWLCALEVGAGELGVCVFLGIPLVLALRKTKLFDTETTK